MWYQEKCGSVKKNTPFRANCDSWPVGVECLNDIDIEPFFFLSLSSFRWTTIERVWHMRFNAFVTLLMCGSWTTFNCGEINKHCVAKKNMHSYAGGIWRGEGFSKAIRVWNWFFNRKLYFDLIIISYNTKKQTKLSPFLIVI